MIKTLIGIPCMAKLDKDFVESFFGMMLAGSNVLDVMVQVRFVEGSLTYDARNDIVLNAVKGGFDRVLWIDSDMTFEPDTFKRLNERMNQGYDYVSALAFRRRSPYKPVIYSKIGYSKDKDGNDIASMVTYERYPENSFFEIAGSGFGCVMTSVKLLKDCLEKFGLPFSPRLGFGEDVSFCLLCQNLGYKMYCDSSIKVGHIGRIIVNERLYKETKNEIQHNNPGT